MVLEGYEAEIMGRQSKSQEQSSSYLKRPWGKEIDCYSVPLRLPLWLW